MGKEFPYYGLWRLLEPDALATMDAFRAYTPAMRQHHFIRRTKEELVDFAGKPIYPSRITNTLSYELRRDSALRLPNDLNGDLPSDISEQTLYEETTQYIQSYYNRSTVLNRSAVRLAMSVFRQRYDGKIEAIAIQVAWAYEEACGATLQDVSTPRQALAAGLSE